MLALSMKPQQEEIMSVQPLIRSSDIEDTELVERTRRGDREAFSELVRRHHERIFQTAYALVGDREDADDLAQDVFLKAYLSLSSFQGQSQFYTWLYRIGVYCCLDWIKSRNRRKNLLLEKTGWHEPEKVFSRPEASEAWVLRRELQEFLEEALASFPPEYRSAVVLREVDGLSYCEIVSALGCSDGTVKSRLFRARARLQTVLEKPYRELCSA